MSLLQALVEVAYILLPLVALQLLLPSAGPAGRR